MKKPVFFITFILGLLTFQNAYSEEVRYVNTDSSRASLILWRVYTQALDSNNKIYMVVDSVLKGDFYIKEKWTPYIYKQYRENKGEPNLNPNVYYLVLALANSYINDDNKRKSILNFIGKDYILPDTPENREMLSKKWDNTKVIYSDLKPRPRIKGRDVDM